MWKWTSCSRLKRKTKDANKIVITYILTTGWLSSPQAIVTRAGVTSLEPDWLGSQGWSVLGLRELGAWGWWCKEPGVSATHCRVPNLEIQVGEIKSLELTYTHDSWVGKIPWRRDSLPTPVFFGFPVAQLVKNIRLPCGRPGFNPWVWKDAPEKGKATHSSILAWRIPWTV